MNVFEKVLRRLFPTLYKQQQELRRQNARAAPSFRLGRALTAPLRAIRRLRKN